MKKILYMAVAVIAALSSCSSEDLAESNNNNIGDAKVFTGTIENGVASRSTLTTDKATNWEATDVVIINGAKYSVAPDATDATKATLTYESGTIPTVGPFKAYYADGAKSGEYYDGTTFKLPASYTYSAEHFNMPMYAESSTTSLGFQNICGILAVKVTSAEMKKVTSITVTSDKAVSGTCEMTEGTAGKYSATATGTADADKTVTLDCGTTGVAPASEGTIFYIPLPALTSATLYVTVNGEISDDKTTEYKNLIYTQSMKATGVTIESNKIYSATFATSLASFSVGAKSKVNFTSGNVYCDAITGTLSNSNLHFETNQTDYPTEWSTTHVGHFYWNSTLESSVAETYTATGKSTYFESKVTVDGTSDLRALTGGYNGEYKYLLDTRGESKRKCGVTVGSATNCMIIAPDNFVGTLKDSYTLDELKAYGLVCLPAASQRRYNTNILATGFSGYYWSATLYGDGNEDKACYLYIPGDSFNAEGYNGRNYGCSVRLVKKNETTTPTLTIDEGTYGF